MHRPGGRHCAGRSRQGQCAGTAQQTQEGVANLWIGRFCGGRARHDDVITTGQVGQQVPHGIAQHAFDAVTPNRTRIDLARHRHAQARRRIAGPPVQAEQRVRGATCSIENDRILRTRTNPRRARKSPARVRCVHGRDCLGRGERRGNQALRRLRPLARRRARILRPSAVAIRARKPWSRARLRLLGWKVRLVAMGPSAWMETNRTGNSIGPLQRRSTPQTLYRR